MSRIHNFCAGPCVLPITVLEQLANDMVDYKGTGMSLIEMSHRGPIYEEIHMNTMASLRRLYAVPDEFDILLLQGGATLQFAMVPMNVLQPGEKAGYVVAGTWGKKAFSDAKTVGNAYAAWDGAGENFMRMPSVDEVKIDDNTRYLHITSNETIGGIRMPSFPDFGVRVIADMSSDYLSRPIPWGQFDVVYGGAQKNLGPAGLTVVFVRKDVVAAAPTNHPAYLRYSTHAEADSMANTPPVFAIWATGLMLNWMEENGGVEGMQTRAAKRSSMLYSAIDGSDGFYQSPVAATDRSHTNVVFTLGDDSAQDAFLSEAEAAGFQNLQGHRSVGGMRASIYNALPTESVEALTDFMANFASQRS